MSLRDCCILEYAEAVLTDPGQWMIAVDYMQSCGNVGLGIADEVLCRVPLNANQGDFVEHDPEIEATHVVESDTVIPLHIVKFCQDRKRGWVLENIIRVRVLLESWILANCSLIDGCSITC
jgi:nuclear pore complex protein Nup85